MNHFKLVVLVAALPLGIVGSIRLGVLALRYYRRNRAEAGVFSLSLMRDHFADGVESWAEAPSVFGGEGFGDGDDSQHSGDDHFH